MFDYIDRLVIVSLFPYIKIEWGLTDTECGMLVSAVYWSILIFALPVSIIIDRWSRKKTIGIMAILWSVATSLSAFTTSFAQLFATRTAIGLGEAGYSPGGTAMISAIFPEEKRARILGIWNASIPLGSALGIALGGIIAETLGWRYAFGIVALPGLIIALLFFKVRDYKTVELIKNYKDKEKTILIKTGWLDAAKKFYRIKSLIMNNLAFASSVFVTTSLLSWLPSYFQRTDGIAMSKASTMSGLIMFLSIIGAPLGGYITDLWYKKNKRARLLFPVISSFLTAIIIFIAFAVLKGTSQYIMLLFAGITAIGFVPGAVAVTQDVVHPGLRATSLSLCVIIQHLLGSSLGPIFTGAVSDKYNLLTALTILPVFSIIAGILFFIGSTYYEKDLNNVEKVNIEIE
jgi:MFS family permease